MADTTATTEEQTAQTTTAQTDDAKNKVPASWDEIFQHPRFKELNTRAQRAEEALRLQQDDKLKEQNKYKELYEQTGTKLTAAESKALRLEIALEKGLTLKQANRLSGTTKEELLADADDFLADLTPKEKENQQSTEKGLPAHKSGGSSNQIDLTTETDPAKVREAIRKGQVK